MEGKGVGCANTVQNSQQHTLLLGLMRLCSGWISGTRLLAETASINPPEPHPCRHMHIHISICRSAQSALRLYEVGQGHCSLHYIFPSLHVPSSQSPSLVHPSSFAGSPCTMQPSCLAPDEPALLPKSTSPRFPG